VGVKRVSGLPLNKQRHPWVGYETPDLWGCRALALRMRDGGVQAIEMSQTNRLNKYFPNKHPQKTTNTAQANQSCKCQKLISL